MPETKQVVVFKGFGEGVELPEHSDLLEVDAEYSVSEVVDVEDGKVYVLDVPNPDFNNKKKASKTNVEFFTVEVFETEIEEVGEEGEEGEEGGEAITIEDIVDGQVISGTDDEGEFTGKVISHTKTKIVVELADSGDHVEVDMASVQNLFLVEQAPPPPAKPARGAAKTEAPAAKAPAAKAAPAAKGKAQAKAEPAKAAKGKAAAPAPAAKGKAAAKTTAPAKATGRGVAKAVPETEEDPDLKGMIILTDEEEDQDIVELVASTDDILGLAEELVETAARDEYRLGGILYHIRKDKSYKDLDPSYAENKGFELYVGDHLNIGYRKAMYLIEIYTKFNKYGLPAETVAELGWSKAQKAAQYMTEENAGEIIELARGMSVKELGDNIKERFAPIGEDNRERAKFVSFKFRLVEDAANSVKNIVEQAALSMGHKGKTLDSVFEHIITEWGMEHLHVDKPARAKTGAAKTTAAPAQAAGRGSARAGARA